MTEAEKCELVVNCRTLTELKKVLLKIGKIQESHSIYDPEYFNKGIDQVIISNGVDWNYFTRTYGIRAKIMELKYYDKL